MRSKRTFNSADIVLCLILAARFHGDNGVRRTAKRLKQVIPKKDRAAVGRFETARLPQAAAEELLTIWWHTHIEAARAPTTVH